MQLSLPIVVVLVAASLSHAQTQSFTTPAGLVLSEGNNEVFVSQPFYAANARYQYIDGTQNPTAAKTLKGLSLRRRPTAVAGTFPARSTTLTLTLAHTTYASTTTTFSSNYRGGLSTKAYSGPLSMPDLSAGSLPPPAPWAIVIPYTTTFAYNGTEALLVEFQCANTSPADQEYPLDTIQGTVRTGGYGTYNGLAPCQVTGRASPFLINASANPVIASGAVSYSMFATDGPTTQPAAWILGTSQLSSSLGGSVCAPIQPLPLISIGMVTDATGGIGTSEAPIQLTYPYAGIVHQVFAQFAALDAGQAQPLKIALSDDLKYVVGNTGPWNVRRLASLASSTAATGTLSNTYVPVMRHEY